jgi:predicted outer membrane repeat protein
MMKLTLTVPPYDLSRTFQFGAINIYGNFVVLENCTFSDNLGYPAGAYIVQSDLHMNGNSFLRNKGEEGAAMFIKNSHVEANCNKFEDNEALGDQDSTGYGGAIYLAESSLDAKLNTFKNNKAAVGGGAIEGDYSQLYLMSNTFTSNTAGYGGAIYGYESAIVSNADAFTNNAAAVSLSHNSTRFQSQIILTYQTLTDIVLCFPSRMEKTSTLKCQR